jgi:hypothetical protein
LTSQQKQQEIIKCEFCIKILQRKSIKKHQLSKECQEIKKKLPIEQQMTTYCRIIIPTILEESQTFVLQMDNQTTTKCPHNDCPYDSHKREHMRHHFRSQHSNDIIIIQQEGLLPQCTNCGLFQQNVTKQHKQTKECQQYTEIKKKRRQELLQYAVRDTVVNIRVYNGSLRLLRRRVPVRTPSIKVVRRNLESRGSTG